MELNHYMPPEKNPVHSMVAHHDSIDFVRINEKTSSPQIVSASHDDTFKIWDLEKKSLVNSCHAHNQGVFCCDISPNGKQIATCSPDQTVAVWDSSNCSQVARGTAHTYKVYFVTYVSESQLVSCGRDKNVFLWDIRNMSSPAKSYQVSGNGTFRSVALSPDRSTLIATTAESAVEGFNFESGERIFEHKVDYDLSVFPADKQWLVEPAIIYVARFFKDNSFLTCHQDMAIRKFQLTPSGPQQTGILRNHLDFVRHIEISENEDIFVSTSQDGSARIWDVSSATPIWNLVGHNQIASCAAITSDSKTIVTSSYDQSLKIYRL